MRIASLPLSVSLAIGLFASACAAQSAAPATEPAARAATVISTDVPDHNEDQATTRSVSQIRIVRLSQVRGEVQLDRSTGLKFEPAFTNLPIIRGERLRTQLGVAEVEFEDNSSLRLITDSQVDFPQLGRNDAGATTTTVHLVQGSMYVSLANSKTPSDFTIQVGAQTLTLTPASHLRVDIDGTTAKLTVFQGEVTAASNSGSLVVGKHKAATFDLAAGAVPTLARMDEPSPFDAWDKNAVDYHKALAVVAMNAQSPYLYGVNDLAYYGAFSDVGGCGMMWRPYLATASFDPYASGIWTWYPTSGYSWVSPYPWGWTPYHSGSWNYCASGGGWGWQPQGGWNGLQNQPAASKIKLPGIARPKPPVRPIGKAPTIVAVNLNSIPLSKPGKGDSFVFQGGSAGLGVPRGVFSNLGKISQHAGENGVATRSVSETQAARGLMPSYTASVNVAQNRQGNGQVASRASGQTNSSSVARSYGSAGVTVSHSTSTVSVSSSSAGSQSFSAPSAPSSGAVSAVSGAHPH
jgi:ferric-dicitrate binding protein FerR (iron transport regulator)